jgi:hypothetical protein
MASPGSRQADGREQERSCSFVLVVASEGVCVQICAERPHLLPLTRPLYAHVAPPTGSMLSPG